MDKQRRVKLTEVFYSIQGESDSVGWPTVFVRLTGCPLRCGYCDTEYAFYGGEWFGFDDVLRQVAEQGCKRVCVTGGEPLAQKQCLGLLAALCDAGYEVSLETSGAMDIAAVDSRVRIVMDIKTPDSQEQARNRWENLSHLKAGDEIKIVVCSEADYQWAKATIEERSLTALCSVLLSPVAQGLQPGSLADWILRDKLPVRMQLQLHKVMWGDVEGK